MKYLIVLITILLANCTSLNTPMSVDETPTKEFGYIFGKVTKVQWESRTDGGVSIVNVENNKLLKETVASVEEPNKVFLIKVTPGSYLVRGMVLVSGFSKSSARYMDIDNRNNTIHVTGGEAVYIGDFFISSKMRSSGIGMRHIFSLDSIKDNYEESKYYLVENYKKFNTIKTSSKVKEIMDSGNMKLPLRYKQYCSPKTGCSDFARIK